MTLRFRVNHSVPTTGITPLDGVPPLPKRREDSKPGSGRRAAKPIEPRGKKRGEARLPRRGR